jgi:hypothetical protein
VLDNAVVDKTRVDETGIDKPGADKTRAAETRAAETGAAETGAAKTGADKTGIDKIGRAEKLWDTVGPGMCVPGHSKHRASVAIGAARGFRPRSPMPGGRFDPA